MNKTNHQNISVSKTNVIASSGLFKIELIEELGTDDYKPLITISHSLAEKYGEKYILNETTIDKYFNRSRSVKIFIYCGFVKNIFFTIFFS